MNLVFLASQNGAQTPIIVLTHLSREGYEVENEGETVIDFVNLYGEISQNSHCALLAFVGTMQLMNDEQKLGDIFTMIASTVYERALAHERNRASEPAPASS